MSIYGTIVGEIFGASKTPAAPASAPGSTSAAASAKPSAPGAGSAPPAPAAGAPPAAPAGSVDVAAILDALNEKLPEELDWRKSIVDLMKVVGSRQQSYRPQAARSGIALWRRTPAIPRQ